MTILAILGTFYTIFLPIPRNSSTLLFIPSWILKDNGFIEISRGGLVVAQAFYSIFLACFGVKMSILSILGTFYTIFLPIQRNSSTLLFVASCILRYLVFIEISGAAFWWPKLFTVFFSLFWCQNVHFSYFGHILYHIFAKSTQFLYSFVCFIMYSERFGFHWNF